ncbi:hypothetical protein ACOSOMT5_P1115 [Acidiphilium sp. MT5]
MDIRRLIGRVAAFGQTRHAWPVIGLILIPCLANLWLLLGVVQADPAYYYSFLASSIPGPYRGAPDWFDPTIGLITEAQGHLAAYDWLHGIVPWWNPYTGIGMPLAAEMQTLAFFIPFVFTLALPHGWLLLRLSLQMLSGVTLYALLTELRTTRLAAFVAGALYALSGTFFMVPHAATPLPFIPLLLLGLERAGRAAATGQRLGWGWITIAVALLVYAGYPEIAYFGGLLAAAWTIARFSSMGAARWLFIGKVSVAGTLGLLMTLPLLVPFLHYLSHAFVGPHDGGFAASRMSRQGDGLELLPFLFGPIGVTSPPGLPVAAARHLGPAWNDVGTWFGPVAVIAALAWPFSVWRFGPQRVKAGQVEAGCNRVIGIALGGFILIWGLRLVGVPMVRQGLNLIPEVARANTIRFVAPAMDLAMLILAGLALDQWQRQGELSRRRALVVSFIGLGLLGAAVLPIVPLIVAWYHAAPDLLGFGMIACSIDLISAVLVLRLLTRAPSPAGRSLMAAIMIGDAMLGLGSGQLSAVHDAHLHQTGVAWLKKHQGLSRIFTTLPFAANYPSAYRIASINSNQLPIDQAWMNFVFNQLGSPKDMVPTVGQLNRYVRQREAAYQSVGVRYVLTLPGSDPFRRKPTPSFVANATHASLLIGHHSLRGIAPIAAIPKRPIIAVDVLIGTYAGASTGPLSLTLCAGTDCAQGKRDLAGVPDDQFLRITLNHPLQMHPPDRLSYKLQHQTGNAVAIWTGSTTTGPLADLRLISAPASDHVQTVFRGKAMTIYQLPHPAAIFAARECQLTPDGWNSVSAQCRAPSLLIRRVAWFAGWHARINGLVAPVGRHGPLFQSVALPAGPSHVRFFYRPRGTIPSVMIALAALVLLLLAYRPRTQAFSIRMGSRTKL